MPKGNIHVGDVGTTITLVFKEHNGAILDISNASSLTFYFLSPSGVTLTKAPSLSTDGTDGKAKYITITGDLDAAGTWELQGKVTFSNGHWGTSLTTFPVASNLY